MLLNFTLQICNDGNWQDAARITVDDTAVEVTHAHAYFMDYAIEHLDKQGSPAASVNLPVELATTFRTKPWFGYLDDILPAGASERWWVKHLGIADLPLYEQKIAMLKHAVIAPVGNLRIKECVDEAQTHLKDVTFTQEDVITHNRDFLSYAQQLGAASGGATGAGGEAPKLLLAMHDDGTVWIDTKQDNSDTGSTHYLVKFPRKNNTPMDQDILRSEYHFYHELHHLGVDTIDIDKMQLVESDNGPSLWLPRFDIRHENGKRTCLGLESVYSAMDIRSGGLKHQDVFERLCTILGYQGATRNAFAVEYLWRDLLNIAFSNTDNHGRNSALIKRGENISLAPVFDFAPMKFDPEVVTRTTTWGLPLEVGGEYDWQAIVNSLNVESDEVLPALRDKARLLDGLYDRLKARGVPDTILNAPTAIYKPLNKKLTQWELI